MFRNESLWFMAIVEVRKCIPERRYTVAWYTGWPFRLIQTSHWHQNISSVIVWGPCTKSILSFGVNGRFEPTWMVTLYKSARPRCISSPDCISSPRRLPWTSGTLSWTSSRSTTRKRSLFLAGWFWMGTGPMGKEWSGAQFNREISEDLIWILSVDYFFFTFLQCLKQMIASFGFGNFSIVVQLICGLTRREYQNKQLKSQVKLLSLIWRQNSSCFKVKFSRYIFHIESGPRTTTFEGSCAEAYVGEQRLVPARSANLEDLAPNANLAGPPYNIIKGSIWDQRSIKKGHI